MNDRVVRACRADVTSKRRSGTVAFLNRRPTPPTPPWTAPTPKNWDRLDVGEQAGERTRSAGRTGGDEQALVNEQTVRFDSSVRLPAAHAFLLPRALPPPPQADR